MTIQRMHSAVSTFRGICCFECPSKRVFRFPRKSEPLRHIGCRRRELFNTNSSQNGRLAAVGMALHTPTLFDFPLAPVCR